MPRLEPEVNEYLGLPLLPPISPDLPDIDPTHDSMLMNFLRTMTERERLLRRMLVKFPHPYTDATMILGPGGEIIGLAHKNECPVGQKPVILIWARDFL
jgi:hypothetical protein